jgi:hypothetical protein
MQITALPGAVVGIAAGSTHSLVLLENGDVYSFGKNAFGQLGLGDTTDRLTPTRITALPGPAAAVEAGNLYSLVLLENGDVYAFGDNINGMLGVGDTDERDTPARIDLPGPAASLSAGEHFSLVVLRNGDVYVFGNGCYGWLGLGDTADHYTPTRITALPGPAIAASSQAHSLVVLANGDVYSWGYNMRGQLGLGDTTDRTTPTRVTGLPGPAVAVSAVRHHSLVVLANGDVYSFGWNENGQLGLGDTADRPNPTRIGELPGPAVSVTAGWCYSLVLLQNGDVYGFGENGWGNLGLGDTVDRLAPARLYALPGPASAVDAGDMGAHTLVVSGPTAAQFRVTDAGDVRADSAFYGAGFNAGSADVAEWVSITGPVMPGDVLEIDTGFAAAYRKSEGACSRHVAGVVSSEPGVTLGADQLGGSQALLALTGIVPVKVTNEGGPIQPGDLLVSSSTPGYAMRWAGDGACPCSLVGKALEPMLDERGVISVLLTAH